MLIFLALAQALCAQDPIRLKARAPGGGSDSRPPAAARPLPPGKGHYVLQFESFPGPEVRQELARRQARVLEYVPDNALMVAVPAAFDLAGLEVRHWFRMAAEDKISPLLGGSSHFFVVVFLADVNMADARALAESYGFQILDSSALLPDQLLIAGQYTALGPLALWDEVSYILPASDDLVSGAPVMACAGALTSAGPVGDYVLVGAGWPVNSSGVASLNYVFETLTGALDPAVVRGEIERAFAEWQKYANISFSPGSDPNAARTIAVQFASGAHGDAYPFTDLSQLAHTFYPAPPNAEPVAGDMHLNAAESWAVGTHLDLFSVVLHETGHALGLGHSDQPGAVMYPYYHLASGLTADDIAGIQSLYGKPTVPSTGSPSPPPANPPNPNPPVSNPPAPNPPGSGGGAGGGDTTPPSLTIASPAGTMVSTTAPSLLFSGTATDNVGVAAVQWSDTYGDSGVAAGTSSWSVSIPLLEGTNTITIRAYDAAGNSGWRSVTVVRN